MLDGSRGLRLNQECMVMPDLTGGTERGWNGLRANWIWGDEMMHAIDLNCDMGESFGAYRLGRDEEIMGYVTSVNIACGYHAGDPGTMRRTVQLAMKSGVAIGAHPGLPDLQGFGRREMNISPQEAHDLVLYQIGALQAFVRAEGGRLQHVKPHGALYNIAARDQALAEAIAEAVYHADPELILFGLSGSALIAAGQRIGLRTASEVFADRTYQADGSLTPRHRPDALIADPEAVARQAVQMACTGKVVTTQGQEISIEAQTLCIHGDGPHALEFVIRIREALLAACVRLQPFV